jgi:AAA15 family ATPase/GTPase
MLLRFYVSNFLSFSDEVEFNMFPGAPKLHREHIYTSLKVPLLKAAAVYGANGSGKSNFIKAVHFLHDVVVHGDLEKCEVKCRPFRLGRDGHNKPSIFGMEFQVGRKVFEYMVAIKDGEIVEESLFETNPAKESADFVFERQTISGKSSIKVNPKWTKTEKERLRFEIYGEDLLPNQSLIFRLKSRMEYATEVVDWFEKNVWILYPKSRYFLTLRLCFDKEYKDFLNQLLPMLGTGMKAIDIEKIPFETFFGKDDEDQRKEIEDKLKKKNRNKESVIRFFKNGNEYIAQREKQEYVINKIKTFNAGESDTLVEFEPEEQSDGTRRMLDLIPAIQKMTNDTAIFFIDEIDRSLHPSMTKSLVEYFMTHQTKGQLVFTTHESNMLDLGIFRQDEIWFTEKDKTGATKMYPLSDYKPRYDLDIQKGYLAGRFGAIPFLGNLKDLNWQHAQK